MPIYHSRRAQVLSEVLEYIDSDDWDHREHFLVFGKKAFELWCQSPRDREDDAIDRDLRKLVAQAKVSRGNRTVRQRISLDNVPPDSTVTDFLEWMTKTFTPEDLQHLIDELGSAAISTTPSKEATLAVDSDAVDAALAARFVHLLDKTINLVGNFGELKIRQTHPGVARYFDEVHQCFLFGMDAACAVLCRALLEAALIDKVDPQHKLKPTSDRRGSHIGRIGRMINTAKRRRLLKKNRAVAAWRIKDAGDSAIHDYAEFRMKYLPQLGEIVEDMRNILDDLYT